jgi:membrane-associated phospholipid phosphatase
VWYNPLSLSYIGATFLCGVILILSIKNAVKRERPFETFEDIKVLENHPTSRSFPSWHTYNIASQGIVIGVLSNSHLLMLVFAVMVVLVAFSRVQLGVHYPSDVVMGCILGILGGYLTLLIFGPFTHSIITCLEQFALHEIEYNRLNSWLGEAWYLLTCMAIYGVLIFLAEYKTLKKIFKKYRG